METDQFIISKIFIIKLTNLHILMQKYGRTHDFPKIEGKWMKFYYLIDAFENGSVNLYCIIFFCRNSFAGRTN